MFQTVPLSIFWSFSLYTQQYIQVMLTVCEQDQDGPCFQAVSKSVRIAVCTVTIAVCTVKNSW